jgi:malonyl-CoA decarboxylase
VHELATEIPGLRLFATLSPVPGFGRWLAAARASNQFSTADQATLALLEDRFWYESPQVADALRPVLLQACAHYLLDVKQGTHPADSVARFHLRNGARLERINWLGDTSVNGFRQSLGMLVNYVYDEDHIAGNHEAYVHEGIVAHSDEVGRLLAGD